ncbi:MAG: hypothetical protein ACOCZ2_04220 [Thermodesulfobacteriota bacterium]
MNKKTGILLFAIVVLLLAFGQASAFFPNVMEVSEKINNRYGSMDSLKARISFSGNSTSYIQVWRQDGKWRQEWIGRDGNSSEIVQAAIGKDRELLASFPEKSSFPLSVFHFWYPGEASSFWQMLGINSGIMSYQFLDKTPCLVVGAEYRDFNSPQLWLHKEKYFPLLVINWKKIEWKWKEYTAVGNYYLPHKVEIDSPEGKVIKMEISWKGINSKIPEQLFNPLKFRKKFSNVDSSIYKSEYEVLDYLDSEMPMAFK